MATLADGSAVLFEALYYAPGNPLFPVLPNPGDPIGLYTLTDRRSPGIVRPRRAGNRPNKNIRQFSRGAIGSGHSDWYKNQWWITPAPIDFGNIVSEKTVQVTVLSTWFDGVHTLDTLDLSALGAGITANIPSPNTFDTLESKTIDFVATPIGAISFEDNTLFGFDNQTVPILTLGRRIILIPYIPQAPVTEQLGWVTDIMKSRDGTEQRHSLRLTPRQVIDYIFLQSDGTAASRLRNILLALQPLLLGIPIWWEAQKVTAASSAGGTTLNVPTDYIDHRDAATIIVVRPDGVSFDAEISSFTSTTITTANALPQDVPLNSLVAPVRLAYLLENPSFSDSAADGLRTRIRVETTDNVDLEEGSPVIDFPTHPTDGLPILSDPNFMGGATHGGGSEMDFQRLDNQLGVPQQFPQELLGDPLIPKGVEIAGSIQEIRRWRALLHYLRGSWRTFYMPTFRRDLVPTQNTLLSATSIIVEDSGSAAFVGANAPHRDVMLELPDGRQFYSRVASIVDNGNGTETLTISPAFGDESPQVSYTPEQYKISWLNLARIEGDVATFFHEYVGTARLQFMTRGVQD